MNAPTALVKRSAGLEIATPKLETIKDMMSFGEILAQSGFFRDARGAAQAVVKVQAGLELGIPPIAAMTGIHIIEGKPTLSAGLIASQIKRSGKYDYRISEHSDEVCTIVFFEAGQEVGRSTFTLKDAQAAGVTKNPTWGKYARNMLFARAMSNGARWHCPDVFNGPVYTPEEMGAPVDGEGNLVEVKATVQEAKAPRTEAAKQNVQKAAGEKKSGGSLTGLIVSYARAVLAADTTDKLAELVERFAPRREGMSPTWIEALDAWEGMRHSQLMGREYEPGVNEKRATDMIGALLAQAPAQQKEGSGG